MYENIFDYCHFDQNFLPVPELDVIENSTRPFYTGLQRFFKWFKKIRNLSLCRKIIEHCHSVQNSHLRSRYVIEHSIRPFNIGLQRYIRQRKYAIWVYVVKYLNIAIFFRISPPVPEMYRKFNPTLFHWATAFFQKPFGWFLKNISLFYIKHISLILDLPSVRQSVSPSVRQSVSPSVRQSISPPVRQSVLRNLQYFSQLSPGSGLVILTNKNGRFVNFYYNSWFAMLLSVIYI